MTTYLIVSTLVWLFLALMLIWERKTWLNLFLKFVFFILSFCGVFLALESLGYIVKG